MLGADLAFISRVFMLPDSFNCRCCFNFSPHLRSPAFRQCCLLFNEANQQIVMMPKSFSALLALLPPPFHKFCFVLFFVSNGGPETHSDQEFTPKLNMSNWGYPVIGNHLNTLVVSSTASNRYKLACNLL